MQQLTGDVRQRRPVQVQEAREFRSRKSPLLLEQPQGASLVDMSDKIRLRHRTGEMIRFRPKVATKEKVSPKAAKAQREDKIAAKERKERKEQDRE